MVHKKSEYALQFLKLSNELRTQIWQENVRFREAQKRLNLSDHYWRYQLIDDPCDCDEESNALLESTRANEPSAPCETKDCKTSEEKRIQTPGTEVGEHDLKKASELETPLPLSSPTVKALEESGRPKPASSLDIAYPEKHRSQNLKEILSNHQNDRSSQNVDDVPSKSAVYSRLNRSPTRQALKSYHTQGREVPVFAAFGWNDAEKNIGEQKTYNVRAPVSQVHFSARLASANRLKDLESHLAAVWKRRQQERSLHHQGPVNLSGIWMTEYQENYSKGQREPLVRNPFARPIVWRFN